MWSFFVFYRYSIGASAVIHSYQVHSTQFEELSAPFLETAILLAPSTALVSPPEEAPVTNPLKSIDNSICDTLAESRQTITPDHSCETLAESRQTITPDHSMSNLTKTMLKLKTVH